MNENLFKEWIRSIAGTASKPHPFNSSSDRIIKSSSFTSPGPGSYDVPNKDTQRTSKYHVIREKKALIDQEFQWMFSKERQSCLNLKENNILLGPGAYDVSLQSKVMKNSWSKASRFKTTPNTFLPDSPGPGYYESSIKGQNIPAAQFVFKSKQKKQLQFLKQKTLISEDEGDVLKDPEIESSEIGSESKQIKRIVQQSSVFASKVPRFFVQNTLRNIGPGSYDISKNQNRSRLKTELPKMIKYKPSTSPIKIKKVSSSIGPGSYNINKYNFSRKLQFKGYPISRETRFNFSGKKNKSTILPGPGSYMQNKYVYLKEQTKNSHKKGSKFQVWSRQSLPGPKNIEKIKQFEASGPGLYNLNAFDIEFRMRRKMQHAQKLKLMEISVPPFNSNVPRL